MLEKIYVWALNMSIEQFIVLLVIIAIGYMFKRQNDLYYKYNALNTIVFALDKHTKHNGVKTGNSQGDFILDWDGKPEKLMTVTMFSEWVARQKKSKHIGPAHQGTKGFVQKTTEE